MVNSVLGENVVIVFIQKVKNSLAALLYTLVGSFCIGYK